MRTVTFSAAILMSLSAGASFSTMANANASHVMHPRIYRLYSHHSTRISSQWKRTSAFKYVLNGKHGIHNEPSGIHGSRYTMGASKAKGIRVYAKRGASLTNGSHYWQVSNRRGNVLGWVNATGVSIYHVANHTQVVNQGLSKVEFLVHDGVTNNNSKEIRSARQLLDSVDKQANTRSEKNQVKRVRNNVRRVVRNAKAERKQARRNAINSVPSYIAKARVLISSAKNVNNNEDAHTFLDEATTTLNKAQHIVNKSNGDLAPLFNKSISRYEREITSVRLDADAKATKASNARASKQARDRALISAAQMFTKASQNDANEAQTVLNNILNGNGTTQQNQNNVRHYNALMNTSVAYSNMAKNLNNQAQNSNASKFTKNQVKKQVGQLVKPIVINE